MKKGIVYLVGAGCGEADLITVRGMELLRRAEVLIYDDLIASELLDAVPAQAEKIYMGKRSGHHSAPQSEINATLVAKALEGKTVVRLKGGDPFVFGRGGEEIEALKAHGIAYEEVPGISSSIAIPAAAGIPVTHRGLSRSFHVITAHTADTADGLPDYIETLAQLEGTLVFLMGLSKLGQIARRLMDGGMSGDTPAAVLSGGNSPNPATVRGTLSDIERLSLEAQVSSPAIILVGATAALDYSPTIPRPLKGLSIALTGTEAISGKLRPALTELGAKVFTAQRSVVDELAVDFDMEKLCREKCTLVFTSSNGVRVFFKRLREQRIDLRRLAACRFAVIGASTGALLESYGVIADLCPEKYTSEGLAQTIIENVPAGEKIYLFRSAQGSELLYNELVGRYELTDVHTYDLHSDVETASQAAPLIKSADYICFSSASGVDMFFKEYGGILDTARCVCIGEVTAKALGKHYAKPFIQAGEISAEGIVQAILDDMNR